MLAVVPGALPGIPDLPDLGPEAEKDETTRPTRLTSQPQGEKTAFGLLRGCRTRAALLEEHALSLSALSLNDTSSAQWIKSEPFRFSVEFWGLDKLVEKERAYSETHFYAGSWFNVYVQTMRKKEKGAQLGIYLHRQNPAEVFPTPTRPQGHKSHKPRQNSDDSEESADYGPSLGLNLGGNGAGLYRAISTTPVGLGSPTSPAPRRVSESKDEEPSAPYKDPRRVTRVSSHLHSVLKDLCKDLVLIPGLLLHLMCVRARNSVHTLLLCSGQFRNLPIMGLEIVCIAKRGILVYSRRREPGRGSIGMDWRG